MADDKIVKIDDMNYAIYKIGEWKNHYEINQIGLSKEIPVTKNTVTHIKFSMDEIRNSEFSLSDKVVNGFVAIAFQLNPKVQEMEIEDIIDLEEKEYNDILAELDGLELLSDDDSIPLEGEEYLIYKLEKECHVTTSTPANEFTKKFYQNELKKIEEALD
jgi:DNA-directed RNA polymerase specialized sigma subunit